jgi:hypothetical protein
VRLNRKELQQLFAEMLGNLWHRNWHNPMSVAELLA